MFRQRLHQRGAFFVALLACAHAGAASYDETDPFAADLEELLEMPILSAAKREEPLFETGAAAFVLDKGFLELTPTRQIPEMLRYAPGIMVAQGDLGVWAVASRRDANRYTNDLLVLRDGRSVYSPLFSGVFWTNQRMLREDLAQIEIVRGAGGTLWGANAVNGVINILSKPAWDTQGWLLSTSSGTEIETGLGLRYGGKFTDQSAFRISFLSEERANDFPHRDHAVSAKSRSLALRYDLELAQDQFLKVQAETYSVKNPESVTYPDPATISMRSDAGEAHHHGFSVLAKWERRDDGDGRSYYLQSYFEKDDVDSLEAKFSSNIWDLEGFYRRNFGAATLSTGGGVRVMSDDFASDRIVSLRDPEMTTRILNTFVQGGLALSDQLRVTAGAKLEHYSLTGETELQPSLRLLATPSEGHFLWASISRVARTVSRAEANVDHSPVEIVALESSEEFPFDRAFVTVSGSPEVDAEHTLAYEGGYRFKSRNQWSAEVCFYYQHISDRLDLRETSSVRLEPQPHVWVETEAINGNETHAWGGELTLRWHPSPQWEGTLNYSYRDRPETSAPELGLIHHVANLNVQWSPNGPFSAFAGLRYQSAPVAGRASMVARMTADIAVHWRIGEHSTLSLEGLNLLRAHQLEYEFHPSEFRTAQMIRRQWTARITLEF